MADAEEAPAAAAGITRRSKRVASTSASAITTAAIALSANERLMVIPRNDSGAIPR